VAAGLLLRIMAPGAPGGNFTPFGAQVFDQPGRGAVPQLASGGHQSRGWAFPAGRRAGRGVNFAG
jgi:hypothetical protein